MKHRSTLFVLFFTISLKLIGQTPTLGIPFGHTSHVSSLNFSQDGEYLLSTSYDGTLKLWDVASGKLLKTSKNLSGAILRGATLSPKSSFAEANWSFTEGAQLTWDIQQNQVDYLWENILGFSAGEDFLLDYPFGWNSVKYDSVPPKSLAFDPDGVMPDGQQFYKISPGKIEFWSTTTFKKTASLDLPGLSESAMVASNGKNVYEVRTKDQSPLKTNGINPLEETPASIKVWNLETPGENYASPLSGVQTVHAVGPSGMFVLISNTQGVFSLFNIKEKKTVLQYNQLESTNLKSYNSFREPVGTISSQGDLIARGTSDGWIYIQNLHTGALLQVLRSHVNPLVRIQADQNKLIHTTDNCDNQRSWSLENGYIQNVRLAPKDSKGKPPIRLGKKLNYRAITPDSTTGLTWKEVNGDRENWKNWEGWNEIEINSIRGAGMVQPIIHSLQDSNSTRSLEAIPYKQWMDGGIFSPKGTKVLIREGFEFSPEPASFSIWDIASGKFEQRITETTGNWAVCSAISHDDRYVAVGTWSGGVKLYELGSGQLITHFKGHSGMVQSMAFDPEGKKIFSSAEDGTIRIWDIDTKKEVAQLIEVDDQDWIVSSPNGLFDASPAAMNRMYYTLFVDGDWEVIELEQLKSRYYEPGLLPKLLNNSSEPLRSVKNLDVVPLYPKVEWKINNDALEIDLKARNGGIGALSLFINGKGVDLDINPDRKTQISYDLKPHQRYLYQHPDSTNILSLRAYNQEGWLKSPAYSKSYRPQAWSRGETGNETGSNTEPLDPKMYIITIGTSEYSGDRLDLQYADQDAAMMAIALESVGRKLFSDSLEVHCLSTKSPDSLGLSDYKLQWQFANRKNIKKVFMDTKKKAKAEDIVIVYFSGHGITYGSAEDAQFYYLTHAMREPELSDQATRDQYTISSDDLTQWLNEIPALKQVIIIDACNSGGVIDRLSSASKSLNSSQIRALDRMKDRTGMFILSGSAADKVSFEASAFGQGLLTYALLKGMLGVATVQTAKGTFVDVMNLFQYARDEVPRLAESINGIQSPVLGFPSNGSSFDIGIFDHSIRIPVANKKPVFVPSKIWNQESFEDEKGIQALINLALRKEAENGAQANLIYVDVADYPAAYSIRGAYSINNGEITIKTKFFQPGKATIDLEAFTSDDPEWLAKKVIKEVKKLMK